MMEGINRSKWSWHVSYILQGFQKAGKHRINFVKQILIWASSIFFKTKILQTCFHERSLDFCVKFNIEYCTDCPKSVETQENCGLILLFQINSWDETSLTVQGLRLTLTIQGAWSLISDQETRSDMPLLRVCMLQLKIPPAATKTWCS